MGCGISTHIEDAPRNKRSKGRHHAIVPPVVEGDMALFHNNKDVGVVMKPLDDDETKDERSNGEMLKEKSVVEKNNNIVNKEEERVFENIGGKEKHGDGDDNNNVEKEHEDRDNSLVVGPGSPSFREYCNEYDLGDLSYSNDYDSMESSKNGSEDDLVTKNKPKNEGNVNSNKEAEKKERRGRGFRNVINKGKVRGRRSFLNFACYNASTANESYNEGTFNKIGAKTA